jgi:hypothetical protein
VFKIRRRRDDRQHVDKYKPVVLELDREDVNGMEVKPTLLLDLAAYAVELRSLYWSYKGEFALSVLKCVPFVSSCQAVALDIIYVVYLRGCG